MLSSTNSHKICGEVLSWDLLLMIYGYEFEKSSYLIIFLSEELIIFSLLRNVSLRQHSNVDDSY